MSLVPLSETLIRYQEDEERKVMALADDSNRELMLDFYERTKITSEDLSREYSEDDIKELCLRTKVRVNMTHMNCVWEVKKRLDRKGRFNNRSRRFINAMLAKAVNRGMIKPCSDEEMAKYHHINICHIKKDNNVRLNRWKKERQRLVEEDLELENEIISEELEIAFRSENEETEDGSDDRKEPSGSPDMPSLEMVDDVHEEIIVEEGNQPNSQPVITEYECLDFVDDNENQQNSYNKSIVSGVSQTEEVEANVDWLQDVNEINSESMTLNSDELLQESEALETQSQGVAADYISFDTQVRTTSTQDADTEAFI